MLLYRRESFSVSLTSELRSNVEMEAELQIGGGKLMIQGS